METRTTDQDGKVVPLYQKDPILGYRGVPNATLIESEWVGGEPVFQVRYEFDRFGRRVLPTPTRRVSEFAIFFGCSYTFGHGVEGKHSFPARLQAQISGLRSYVYAQNGYGPQQMYLLLNRKRLASEIDEREGVGIYTYMDHHMPRLLGSMHFFNRWGREFPELRFGKNGELVSSGTFESNHPWRSRLFRRVGHWELSKIPGVDWPMWRSLEDWNLLSETILQSKALFYGQFPKTRAFIVIVFPGSRLPEFVASTLRKNGVTVLDRSDLFSYHQKEFWLNLDGHPNALAYEKLSKSVRGEITSSWLPRSATRRREPAVGPQGDQDAPLRES